jgi:molybdenum cofactor cytidylyltransferase
MGQAKQLLPLGQSTVLAQTIENVLSASFDEVILVLGSSAATIQKQLSQPLYSRLKVVLNQSYADGMASSLRAGLAAIDQNMNAALIVLGDQPFVRPQTLDQIVQEFSKSCAKIAVPMFQGQRGNPVLLDRAVFASAMDLQGDVGCRAIFGRYRDEIMNIQVEDIGVLLDIDDPEDYRRWKARN